MRLRRLRAYECNVCGTDWHTVINAFTAGRAKSEYLRHVQDAWPDVKYTDVISRLVGAPADNRNFLRTCEYRGVDYHVGQSVRCGESEGMLTGEIGAGSNFEVEFTSGRYAGARLFCHHSELAAVEESSQGAKP